MGYFEQAQPLLPNSSQISESLAYVARRQGQWDQSEVYFNEAERLEREARAQLPQRLRAYAEGFVLVATEALAEHRDRRFQVTFDR